MRQEDMGACRLTDSQDELSVGCLTVDGRAMMAAKVANERGLAPSVNSEPLVAGGSVVLRQAKVSRSSTVSAGKASTDGLFFIETSATTDFLQGRPGYPQQLLFGKSIPRV